MKDDTYASAAGFSTFRKHYMPEEGVPIQGIAVFVHGLGDHGSRYGRVLERFVQRGVYCIAPDLPGHGRSEGKRGFIPSMDAVHSIIGENLAYLRSLHSDVPAGILGHSMGGFLALDHVSRNPDGIHFCWASSPLIDASGHRGKVMQTAARLLSRLAPAFSIHNGIRSGACKRDPERILETENDPLMHRRLSMRLGQQLLNATAQLQDTVAGMSPELRLLITHGSDDTICPTALSQTLFPMLPAKQKRYALLDGLLHEPFNDIGRDAFYHELNSWLDTTITHSIARHRLVID
ncbi:MAG: alpha/beta fold hydrolase [Verrucomicrobia bacterium]|nr:alpha/beta fold hydrolase [Verrucomicrobiota bacterium]